MGPTIVIGLGGFGSEIVSMIQKILDVQDSYQHKQDKMIKLAIVDTDVSGLMERKRCGFRGTMIQISDNMTVEKYLQYDQEAKRTWFPSCQILSKKSLTEGAGQVRAISRLALNMALQKRSFYPLYEEIDKLYLLSEYNTEQATRVIMVSSLAGGTGSGIFLPLAMHLQDYLRRTYRNTEPLFKGFFIMPSMFEYVVKGGAERKSLRANAYAAIKELNAFTLMRDRQIDPKNYPQMKIELMDDQGGIQTYRSSPYDLCFLFEKQNRLDKHLSYDESKKNIAECIWMQTLNPLLEITGSMEDNLYKIVSTTDGTQYERFAGMGISRIQYPYAELMNYISIVTAGRVIGNRCWYAADKNWQDSKIEFEDVENISRKNIYIKYSENTEDEYWRERIDNVIKKKWVSTYLEAVEKLCMTELEKSSLIKEAKNTEDEIGRSINNGESWPNAYNNLRKKYEALCLAIKEEKSDILQNLYQCLEPKIEKNRNQEDYKLERWLTGITNANTPVENRYFLYKLCEELKKCFEKAKEQEREERKKSENEIEAFEKNFEDWENIRKIFRANSIKREKEKEITMHMKNAKDAKINQVENEIKYKIYSYLLERTSNMAKEYEKLLDNCNELVSIEEKKLKKNLEIRFDSYEGCVTRMVCISPKCLKKIKKLIENNMMKINSIDKFAEMLYEKAMIPLKGSIEKLRKYLLDFWFEQYKNTANGKDPLDVDVLTALKNEAIWEKDLDENNLDNADLVLIKEYIENVIALVRDVFANPFIRVPDVRQWHIMEMNTYPAEVPGEKEDALLANIVKECMEGKGGVQHEKKFSPKYIESKEGSPKYQIDFYRAFFGVAAGEVSAFLNPEEGSPIRSGESFDAYADIIHRLDNVNQEDNFLSPHIDKNWHKISQMPELSIERDKERKIDLLEALFFGLIKEIIKKNDTEFEISKEIDKRNFLRNDYKIKTFSQLVKYTDESPFIIYGLLKQLENQTQYGMEQLTVNWEKLKNLEDEIIQDYCEEQEQHGSSKSEAEENIWEAWRRLAFQIQIQPYGYTGIKALEMMCEESCGLTNREETEIWLKRKFEKRK